MRRGPEPQPTLLKILRGNPHQHALPTHEPRPHPLPTACPDELIISSADRTLAIVHCEL
jgi:hypothetical protein